MGVQGQQVDPNSCAVGPDLVANMILFEVLFTIITQVYQGLCY